MKKEIYMCDICKKETDEKDLLKVVLPYQLNEDTTVSFVSWKPIDRYDVHQLEICQKCAENLVKSYRNFMNIENIPYAGWSITYNE